MAVMSRASNSLELPDFFNSDESGGHHLLQFLQKKRGGGQRRNYLFMNCEPMRLRMNELLEELPEKKHKIYEQGEKEAATEPEAKTSKKRITKISRAGVVTDAASLSNWKFKKCIKKTQRQNVARLQIMSIEDEYDASIADKKNAVRKRITEMDIFVRDSAHTVANTADIIWNNLKENVGIASSETSMDVNVEHSQHVSQGTVEQFDSDEDNIKLSILKARIKKSGIAKKKGHAKHSSNPIPREANIPGSENSDHNEMRMYKSWNFSFIEFESVEYASYYKRDIEGVGYFRFKPKQIKPRNRATRYHMYLIPFSGSFRITANEKESIVGLGDMIAISKSVYYEIENLSDEMTVLMMRNTYGHAKHSSNPIAREANVMSSSSNVNEVTLTNSSSVPSTELVSRLKNIPGSENSDHNEMRMYKASNLSYIEFESVKYASYYKRDMEGVGYLRFKPKQIKPRNIATRYHTHFVTLIGSFRITANEKENIAGLGDMIDIPKSVYYEIENLSDEMGVLMVMSN